MDIKQKPADNLRLRFVLSFDNGVRQLVHVAGFNSCIISQGKDAYKKLFPEVQIADLYQNAESRPRRGFRTLPTLTTGCSRMFLFNKGRFASGLELLILHGIPVAERVAEVMECAQVQVSHISHRAQCKLAGNSMHACAIGLMFLAVLRFTGI